MKSRGQKILSMALSVAMMFSMTGMNTVFAAEGGPPVGASGLCEHHPEHSADCGYTEGTPEVPCDHEHRSDCYKEVTECVHEHTDDCYPAEDSVSDNDATPSDATPKKPTNCTHVCSEESGCITTELDCQHQHDGDCGYVAAVPGMPCAFVCGECAKGGEPPANAGPFSEPPANDTLSIVSVSPADGATDVPVDTEIAVTFSQPVDFTTHDIEVNLWHGDEPYSGGGSGGFSNDSKTYTRRHDQNLLPNTEYNIRIRVTERTSGTQLLYDTSYTFTTGAGGDTAEGSVTGSLLLDGRTVVSDLTQDGGDTTTDGVTWAWDAGAATLTLTGSDSIGDDGTIVFHAAGDVTVEVIGTVSASALTHNSETAGTLTLTGGGGTLTLANEWTSTNALAARAGLTISGLTVSVSTTGGASNAVWVDQGSFTMTGSKLTAAAAGTNAAGISARENITISGGAEVTASGGVYGLHASGDITISGGTVEAVSTGSSNTRAISASGALNISGGSVTAKSASSLAIAADDGVTVGNATLGVGETNENKGVRGNLTVSHANANVTVNGYVSGTSYGSDDGNLTVSAGTVQVTGYVAGDLTVSGGTVTVGGTVYGLTNHTGGTLNGKNAPTQITFTAEQTGGVSGTADSTGIALTFSQAVTGLTESAIRITNGSGSATTIGAPTGSGTVWTVPVTVRQEGTVNITIDQFGDFGVTNNPQTATVYKGDSSAPIVQSVVVSPLEANVQKGTTQQFTAFVMGENNPAQTVTWEVIGGKAGTSISNIGLLTVAADETAATLMVKAISTVDTRIDGSALVTVTDTPVTTYPLIVMDGSGGGNYEAGATVTIMADPLLPGEVFDKWVLTSGGGTLADATSATTIYTMPGNAATVTATYKDAPAGSHTITASAGTGGSISPSGTITVNSGESKTFTISANSNYNISSVTVDGVNQGAISSYTFHNVTGNHTISATFNYNGGGSSGGGGGGSSSGGGSSNSDRLTGGTTSSQAADRPSSNVDASGSVKSADVTADTTKAIADAVKAGGTPRANVLVKNAGSVSPQTLRDMAAAAKKAGGTSQLMADTTVNGKIVARVYLEAAKAATLQSDIRLGVSVAEKDTKATKALFEKFYDNNDLMVISMAHEGPIGMRVQVAVRVDLARFDPKSLYFYAYDKKTNTYYPIANPACRIDENGWLYFHTDRGGDIVISSGELVKKTGEHKLAGEE